MNIPRTEDTLHSVTMLYGDPPDRVDIIVGPFVIASVVPNSTAVLDFSIGLVPFCHAYFRPIGGSNVRLQCEMSRTLEMHHYFETVKRREFRIKNEMITLITE